MIERSCRFEPRFKISNVSGDERESARNHEAEGETANRRDYFCASVFSIKYPVYPGIFVGCDRRNRFWRPVVNILLLLPSPLLLPGVRVSFFLFFSTPPPVFAGGERIFDPQQRISRVKSPREALLPARGNNDSILIPRGNRGKLKDDK